VTWSVVTGDGAWADLDSLSLAERAGLSELLIRWVTAGPPRRDRRWLAGLDNVFEDEVATGVLVTYFADEVSGIVGIPADPQSGKEERDCRGPEPGAQPARGPLLLDRLAIG